MPRILLIDDDLLITNSLRILLEDHGHEVRVVNQATDAPSEASDFQPDAIILDLEMPGRNGLDLLPDLKLVCPRAEVVVYTGTGDIPKAVRAIKLGAYDFLVKATESDEVLVCLDRALEARRLREENARLRQVYDTHLGPGAILVFSEKTRRTLELAERYRRTPEVSVLIEGESGTGKELIARILHNRSTHRRNREFVAINCAAIPGEILESELFGSVRGAFTGATQTRKGLIEVADGGTLFMDEIGDTSPQFQSKLLRVIQEKEIRRVGDTASRSVDVRIVAATNRDLKKMIGEGTFREDLYYRLSVIDIIVPPLRERKEDIQPLVDYFLQDINGRLGTGIEGVSAQAMAVLMAYPWPGNVRELRNSLERAALLSGHKMLKPEDFPLAFEHYLRLTQKDRDDEIIPLKEMERRHLLKAMQKYNYNQKLVAKKLGIGYTTLWRKLKESEKDINSTP